MRKLFLSKPTAYLLIFSFIFFQVSFELIWAANQPQPEAKKVASAVTKSAGLALGIAMSPGGGQGKEMMSIDVSPGSRSLVVGIGGATLQQEPEGAVISVKDPQGRPVDQVVRKISVDKGLEGQLKTWAKNVLSQERISGDQITTAKADALLKKYPLAQGLQQKIDNHAKMLQTTPNLGVVAKDKTGKVRSIVILNPTPGKWSVEVNSQPNSRPFQVVAAGIPRDGLPSNVDAIGRPLVDKFNRDFPRHKQIRRWGCNRCCWCMNTISLGVAFALATYLVAGGVFSASVLLSVAFWKTAGVKIAYYTLYYFISDKMPATSVWDYILGWIKETLIRYACRIARYC